MNYTMAAISEEETLESLLISVREVLAEVEIGLNTVLPSQPASDQDKRGLGDGCLSIARGIMECARHIQDLSLKIQRLVGKL